MNNLPIWYWNRGLHDAMITKISFHPLDYDFTKPKPIRNFILIELDSSNALFDTHIKTINLFTKGDYECKVIHTSSP